MSRERTENRTDESKLYQRRRRSFLRRLGVGLGLSALSATSYAGLAAADSDQTSNVSGDTISQVKFKGRGHTAEIQSIRQIMEENEGVNMVEQGDEVYLLTVDTSKLPPVSNGERTRAKRAKRNVMRKMEMKEQKAMREFKRGIRNGSNGEGHEKEKGKGHEKGKGRGHN